MTRQNDPRSFLLECLKIVRLMTLVPLLARADVPPSLITPMTPDVVESYENVRPDADCIK
jgi:hypothetical protein